MQWDLGEGFTASGPHDERGIDGSEAGDPKTITRQLLDTGLRPAHTTACVITDAAARRVGPSM